MIDSKLRIVYMGTPDFAVPPLQAMIAEGYVPVAVVTAPDRKGGRGQLLRPSAVKQAAQAEGIDVLQPESLKELGFVDTLHALDIDLIVVVAFKILPPEVYTMAKNGAFNLHASLLPAFRGAAPIQRALMAGVETTGVTTFFLKPLVDTGDMILQERLGVGPNETGGELHDRLSVLGANAVVETIRRIEANNVDPTPQDDRNASPAPKIFKDDMRIDWNLPAMQVHDHIRALSPYPAAWTTLDDDTLKLLRAETVNDFDSDAQSGAVLEAERRLVVACRTGAIEIIELQPRGKRPMNAAAFLNGRIVSVGDTFI